MTLTRIAAATGLLTLVVQGLVIFGWSITSDQQAWLTGAIVAAGGFVHAIVNPNVKIGKT